MYARDTREIIYPGIINGDFSVNADASPQLQSSAAYLLLSRPLARMRGSGPTVRVWYRDRFTKQMSFLTNIEVKEKASCVCVLNIPHTNGTYHIGETNKNMPVSGLRPPSRQSRNCYAAAPASCCGAGPWLFTAMKEARTVRLSSQQSTYEWDIS